MLTVIPTLWVTSEFVYSHRWDILDSLQHILNRCLVGVRRCFTRKKLSPPAQDHHLPFNVTSYPKKPAVGKPPGQIARYLQSTHRPPLLPELDYEIQGIWKEDMRYIAHGTAPVYTVCDKV